MHLCAAVPHRFPSPHHGDHTIYIPRHPTNWRVPPLHYDFRHTLDRHHRLCAQRAPSLSQHSQDAPLGPLRVPGSDPAMAVHATTRARWPASQVVVAPAGSSGGAALGPDSQV